MSASDKAHNTAETVRGKAKEVVGRASKDEGLQIEGKVDQVVAHLKQAREKVKDALRSASATKTTKESGPTS
ncbi:MAG TPA: CsbD family protein [Acidimicrobiales bacterium]|nr:CsbD family protein [Acidimicrobiales bacterium]